MSGSIQEIQDVDASSSTYLPRSLILDLYGKDFSPHISRQRLRMLVVSSRIESHESLKKADALVNSRFLNLSAKNDNTELLSSIRLFWNLQTLIVNGYQFKFTAPTDIWYISHIRHIDIKALYLPDPPNVEDGKVLANLQSLGMIVDFMCSEEVVKRIPNIRKLIIVYSSEVVDERFCLNNLDCLDKLETLGCYFYDLKCLNINYPQSLKKVNIGFEKSQYCWQDILDKIGALPLLQKLTLGWGAFNKEKWETSESKFCSLKFLSLWYCKGLQVWTSEAPPFPKLEHLHLYGLNDLEEIPSNFAEISTLKLICMYDCTDSAIESAKWILEEQETLDGEEDTTLQVRVELTYKNNLALRSLSSLNFDVD